MSEFLYPLYIFILTRSEICTKNERKCTSSSSKWNKCGLNKQFYTDKSVEAGCGP